MKRPLAILAALLVLAAAVLIALPLKLDSTATPLPFTVLSAQGDASAAEGLHLRTAISYGSQLRWDTDYDIGANTWETTHALSGGSYNNAVYYYYDPPLRTRENTYLRRYITLFMQQDGPLMTHLKAAAQQAADTSDGWYGSGYTELLHLRDYYDTYPLYLSIDRQDISLQANTDPTYTDRCPVFDKLRIPVGEADWMEPTLYRYSGDDWFLGGDVTLHTDNSFTPFSLALGDNGVLTTVGFAAGASPQEDWAPEGFGLWYIPIVEKTYSSRAGGSVSVSVPDMTQLRLICPLDIAKQRVVGLQFTYDRSDILLTTVEDGRYVLRVLDAADFRCKLTLPVSENAQPYHASATVGTQSGTVYEEERDGYAMPVYNSSEELLVACIGPQLTVLRPDGDGWAVDFTCDLLWPDYDDNGQVAWSSEAFPLNDGDYYYYDGSWSFGLNSQLDAVSMCYRDGKLAFSTGDSSGEYTLAAVYDRTGLLYTALLDTGLASQGMYISTFGFFNPMYFPQLNRA